MSIRQRIAALMLHGLCSTPDELRSVSVPLRAAGCTVEELIVPGYSFDAANTAARPFGDWIAAVVAAVAALRLAHDKVVVVGISAGATLALAATLDRPALADGLVLVSTTLRFDGWAVPWHHRLLPLALYTPLGRFWRYRERPPYGVRNERIRAWVEAQLARRRISAAGAATLAVGHLREHDRMRRAVLRRLGAAGAAQVLAVHARDDEVAGPGNVALIAARLGYARLRTMVCTESFHMITIDNDRHLVARAIVDFVAEVGAGTTAISDAVATTAPDRLRHRTPRHEPARV